MKATNLKCSMAAAAAWALAGMWPGIGAAQTVHPSQPPAAGAKQETAPETLAQMDAEGQSGAMGGGMKGGMMRGMKGGMMGGGMMSRGGREATLAAICAPRLGATSHIEGRIAFLRAELGITEAQTDAWNAFAEALRASAKELMMAGSAKGPGATPAARLDAREKQLEARLDAIRKIKPIINRLYSSLSDDQKKVADALLLPSVDMGMHMGMGMGMGMGAGMGMESPAEKERPPANAQ